MDVISGKDVNVLVPMADLLNHDAGAAYVGSSLAFAHFRIGNFRHDKPALKQESSVQPLANAASMLEGCSALGAALKKEGRGKGGCSGLDWLEASDGPNETGAPVC